MLCFFLAAVVAYEGLRFPPLIVPHVLVEELLATKALFATAARICFGVTRRETLVDANCAQHLLGAAIDMLDYIFSREVLWVLLLVATAAFNRRSAHPAHL